MTGMMDVASLLLQALYFGLVWLGVSFLFLIATGHEKRPASPWKQSAYVWLIAISAGTVHYLIFGQWALAAATGIGAWLLTRLAARRFPDWNSRGQAFFGAFAATTALFLLNVAAAMVRLGPDPFALFLSLILFTLEITISLLSAYFAFEVLNVICRVHWRRLFPPVTFHTGYHPKVSIHVPAHSEPVEMVKETLSALTRLDYPNYEIVMVDDNTKETELWQPVMEFCRDNNIRVYHLQDYPGFKSGALNFALSQTSNDVEIIAVVDSDYVVEPNYLKETIPYFQDPRVGFVQTPQSFCNANTGPLRRNDLAQRYWFEVGMRSRNERNSIIFCGTMGLIRKSALKRIGGWDEWCITEDAEASFRMLSRGYESVYIHKVYGRGLIPTGFDDLRKQRFRWAFGGVQIMRRYWRQFFPWARAEKGRFLTPSQRFDYLVGGLVWFNDLIVLLFSLVILTTSVSFIVGVKLPLRDVVAAALLVPALSIIIGVLRTAWALRITTGCTWTEGLGTFMSMVSLSFTIARACLSAIRYKNGVFLRTPKFQASGSLVQALRSATWELALGGIMALTIPVLIISYRESYSLLVAAILAWHASVYLSSAWNALALERQDGMSGGWRLVLASNLVLFLPLLLWVAAVLPQWLGHPVDVELLLAQLSSVSRG